ncbi:MAG: hypothetical protein IPM82_13490 [Saprospiraceae bacterium]|nr:hypothetical protein [Saprospiraceae bacterium]
MKTLTEKELHQLEQFIQSPLFNDGNRPQKTKALLEYLASFYHNFEAEGLKKGNVFKTIFKEEPFSEPKLDKAAT